MIRIALTGPESSGKTTLGRALEKHFKIDLIDEYAREFLVENEGEYDQPDLDEMAQGHLENVQLSQNSIQIVDSDFVVFKVWSDYKYGFTSTFINKLVSENYFDLHVLCAPDIPWEEDPLRENPDNRHELFEMYLDNLQKFKKDFIIVNGEHKDRFEKSILAIEDLLN